MHIFQKIFNLSISLVTNFTIIIFLNVKGNNIILLNNIFHLSTGLLDTGATKTSWENLESQCVDSSSISSEAESVDDVWTISKEQREYYVKQFKTMQAELNGVILGISNL